MNAARGLFTCDLVLVSGLRVGASTQQKDGVGFRFVGTEDGPVSVGSSGFSTRGLIETRVREA